MIKLFLNRFRRDHGAIVGRLSQEVVNRQGIVAGHQYICDTMEREGGCLEPGEYHIMVAKCKCFARQMLFLEPEGMILLPLPLFLSPKPASFAAWSARVMSSGVWKSFMPFLVP